MGCERTLNALSSECDFLWDFSYQCQLQGLSSSDGYSHQDIELVDIQMIHES